MRLGWMEMALRGCDAAGRVSASTVAARSEPAANLDETASNCGRCCAVRCEGVVLWAWQVREPALLQLPPPSAEDDVARMPCE